MKILKYSLFAISAAAFLLLFSVLFLNFPAQISRAGSSDNVSGWAWSENIGWLSFNCVNTSSCGVVNYGVNIDNATGLFTGYAWSENIGWINFAPLGSYPSPPDYSARLDNATNQVNGWARAAAYDGGWDGWIKMSGDNYAVMRTRPGGQCALEGYAWGSDVIGWLRFNGANYRVGIASPQTVTPYFSYSPTNPISGVPVHFTDATETTCGASIVSWNWTFQDGDPSFSSEQNPIVRFLGAGSKSVSMTVTDSDGNVWSVSSGAGVGTPPDVEVRGRPEYREF